MSVGRTSKVSSNRPGAGSVDAVGFGIGRGRIDRGFAIAHWQAAATPDQLAALAWVALRHEIDYKHPALPTDGIIASTWVGTAEAVRFERHVEILRAADRKVLARSRTLWCPISRESGRITRVGDDVRRVFSTDARTSP